MPNQNRYKTRKSHFILHALLRQPESYFDSVKVRFSPERQKYPGLKVLNTAFGDAGIPYVIRAKQPGKTKQANTRETYWYIENNDLTKEAEHPLQDAPELTELRDTSGGSYVRRIIYFRSIDRLSTEFLRKIFDEIRAKQASKKITNVYGKVVATINEALAFDKNIDRKDVEMLVVNRIIGNDLFSKRGVPLHFMPLVKDKEPDDIHDLLLDCQAKISYTLFNKNNKQSFWLLLERIMSLLIQKPRSSIRSVYDQISQSIMTDVFTFPNYHRLLPQR